MPSPHADAEAPTVSVVIPTYRGGNGLVELVRGLMNCNARPLEIIVIVDDPDREALNGLLTEFSDPSVKVFLREGRQGKVSALNEALKLVRGDVVLFLDDDVRVDDPRFIDKVAEAMKSCDLLDVKKVIVGKGLLAKLVYIEYTAYNFASKMMAKLAGRAIAINGAAFAVKRRAIDEIGYFKPCLAEDLDFALRSFVKGCRFSFLDSTYVLNYAPSSWTHWLKQRKRWAVGLASWLRENYRVLLRAVREVPHVIIPGIILTLPSLLTMIVALALHGMLSKKATYAALLPLSSLIRELIPVTAAVSISLIMTYTVTTLAFAFLLLSLGVLQYVIAKVTGLKPYAHLIPVYLLFYQTVWLTILSVGLIRVLIFGDERVEDWVV